MDNYDSKLKNLNHIKERCSLMNAFEALTEEDSESIHLAPQMEAAVDSILNKFNPKLPDKLVKEVKSELINAIFIKIAMINDNLIPYVKS